MTGPLVLKCGGELLDDSTRLQTIVSAVARISRRTPPANRVELESSRAAAGRRRHNSLTIVHGGGKEIDAALKAAGIEKQQVDGLRITDDRTLEVVVSVLAGAVNTRFVAALGAAGVAAVGLTGADARCGLSIPAPRHSSVDGHLVDLGRVGVPSVDADAGLLTRLMEWGFVPVVASIGVTTGGQLVNVNADTFAGHLAAALGARRLVLAGTTSGVLDDAGTTMAVLEPQAVERLIRGRTATAGMIAKLRAGEHALSGGVGEVVIVDGRDGAALEEAAVGVPCGRATRLVTATHTR